nr:MAG TPA: hypothetical protein [Caudoviricetes sp.]
MKRKKNGAKTAILCISKGKTLLIITSGESRNIRRYYRDGKRRKR